MNELFQRPQDLYLASADKISLIIERVDQLRYFFSNPNIDNYYSVIGGLSGLNHLIVIKPKNITFFDINQDAIPYCKFIIELIKSCSSPKDFIESFFLRRMDEPLNEDNQDDYLLKPIDYSILESTLESLSEESKQVYNQAVLPLVKKEKPSEPRNCMRVVPCWNPHHRVPVGGGESTGYDESGKRVPNTNTFFYGYGWLYNEDNYNKVKSCLINSSIEIKVINFLEHKSNIKDEEQFVYHISNIDDWFPSETSKSLVGIMDSCKNKNGSFGITTSLNHIYIMSKDSHEYAYDSIKKYVTFPTTEITHKKPWGFHEFERENLEVNEFLSSDSNDKKECCIIHILVGEGISKQVFRQTLSKCLSEFSRIIIMEHNSQSFDWVKENSFYSKDSLLKEVKTLTDELGAKHCVKNFEYIRGERCQQRNMLLVLDDR